ncbi:MAG: hybrid sensor histidine kinase/response regulator [Nitrosomonas sp.]|nr:MAG: hybrid sensor histidine kinase/response regulator [Nitrosomonas sp.]
MKLDPEVMRQLVAVFKAELGDQSQIITDGLLALEKGISGDQRKVCLDGIFRAAHNIKGSARGIDVRDVADIAHGLETLFSKFLCGDARITAQSIDLCLQGIDRMSQCMTAHESGVPSGVDVQGLLNQLTHWCDELPDSTSGIMPRITDRARDLPPDRNVSLAAFTETVDCHASGNDWIQSRSAIVSPFAADAAPGDSMLQSDAAIRVGMHKLDEFSALIEDLLVTKIEMDEHVDAVRQLFDQAQSLSSTWLTGMEKVGKARADAYAAQQNNWQETVTAGFGRLWTDTQYLYKRLRDSSRRCGQTYFQLQDQVRALHLVPAVLQLQPLARLARDVATELGKQVNFEISGGEIEIDRPILDGIKDPLMHLVRNAIDHGIESPQYRLDRGKSAAGRLRISISKADNRILIVVQDDGIGIDAGQIAQQALRKRAVTQHELSALTTREIINLIFRPGFSSKEIITNISGRGVGLDVVMSNILGLKGNVSVETAVGQGTVFTLSLPLRLSADHGLLVRVNDVMFAVPIASVERVMEITHQNIVEVGGNQAVLIDNKAVPVRALAVVLEIKRHQPEIGQKISLIVVAKGMQRVALIVDEIVSEREIVIKRFKPPLKSVRNVMGATFMGSGEVVVVLNPHDLVTAALRLTDVARLTESRPVAETGVEAEAGKLHILVVDDSVTIRTFEKTLLETNGYRVTVAVNGRNAWAMLQQQPFDLVIADIEMPEMNGFELCEHIKRSEKLGRMPVVIVTSLNSEAEKQRGIEVGANAYIVKSQFESKVLLDVINQLI